MSKWFDGITDVKDLKKKYFKLAKKYHPDTEQGDEAIFKEIVNEYEEKIKILSEGEIDGFRGILDKIINFDITIEIIGDWIWVSGNTYNYKKELKELGFRWARKKKMWYYHEGEYKKISRRTLSIDEIKERYKTTVIKNGGNDNFRPLLT